MKNIAHKVLQTFKYIEQRQRSIAFPINHHIHKSHHLLALIRPSASHPASALIPIHTAEPIPPRARSNRQQGTSPTHRQICSARIMRLRSPALDRHGLIRAALLPLVCMHAASSFVRGKLCDSVKICAFQLATGLLGRYF